MSTDKAIHDHCVHAPAQCSSFVVHKIQLPTNTRPLNLEKPCARASTYTQLAHRPPWPRHGGSFPPSLSLSMVRTRRCLGRRTTSPGTNRLSYTNAESGKHQYRLGLAPARRRVPGGIGVIRSLHFVINRQRVHLISECEGCEPDNLLHSRAAHRVMGQASVAAIKLYLKLESLEHERSLPWSYSDRRSKRNDCIPRSNH